MCLGYWAALADLDSGRAHGAWGFSADAIRSKVADSALKHGAAIITDVTGGALDPNFMLLPHTAILRSTGALATGS